MGQVYSVQAKLQFRNSNPDLFCKIMENKLDQKPGTLMNDPEECFCRLTTNHADCVGPIWTADFCGSYGWEQTMVNAAYASARGLADDSYIEIDVWDGEGMTHRIEVVEGRVLHTIIDTVDSYDIDDEEDFDG